MTERKYMDVEDLDVYRKLCQLHIEVCDLTHQGPKKEKYELGGQARRSSNSSPAQLAKKVSIHRLQCSGFRIRNDVSPWLAISGFLPLPIWELELGTYWVFAGLESEPFSLLNTETRERLQIGETRAKARPVSDQSMVRNAG